MEESDWKNDGWEAEFPGGEASSARQQPTPMATTASHVPSRSGHCVSLCRRLFTIHLLGAPADPVCCIDLFAQGPARHLRG